MRFVTAQNGWRNSQKPGCTVGRNSTTSSSMHWLCYVSKLVRNARGKPQVPRGETAAADSRDWPHPRGFTRGAAANTASLSHQTAVMGVHRPSTADLHERRIPLRRWTTEALQKDPGHSRTEPGKYFP